MSKKQISHHYESLSDRKHISPLNEWQSLIRYDFLETLVDIYFSKKR